MQKSRLDLTKENGGQWGWWKVLGYIGLVKQGRHNSHIWRCRCRCGRIRKVDEGNLLRGRSTKCRSCAVKKSARKHGRSRKNKGRPDTTYSSWTVIHRHSDDAICDRWKGPNGFINFLQDMGDKPKPNHLYRLERIDPKKQWGPGNARWSKWRDEVKEYEYEGSLWTVGELAFTAGTSWSVMSSRLKRMSVEEAVTTPVKQKAPRKPLTKTPLTAFGETQTLCEWAKDPRCVVNYSHVARRYREGWEGERLLTTPLEPRDGRFIRSRGFKDITGETIGVWYIENFLQETRNKRGHRVYWWWCQCLKCKRKWRVERGKITRQRNTGCISCSQHERYLRRKAKAQCSDSMNSEHLT